MIDRPPAPQITEGSFPVPDERQPGEEAVPFADWMARGIPALETPPLAEDSAALGPARSASDQAMVFNEDGFFAAQERFPETRILALNASASTLPASPAIEVTNLSAGLLSQGDPSGPAIRATGRRDKNSAVSGAPLVPEHLKASAISAADAYPSGEALESAVELGFTTEGEALSSNGEHAARAADARAYAARAQSTLRIAIRDIEHGLQILVAARALDKEERERLAYEIAALLSRHGLVARDTRIVGPDQPRDPGRS